MIDTHAHLTERFNKNIEDIVMRAKKGGLKAIILAASNMKNSEDNLKLAKQYPNFLYPAVGVHPQERELNIKNLREMVKEAIAIGECGLEFVEGCDKNLQIENFKKQIELALEYKKPLIVHSKEAAEETIEILKSHKGLKGVIHCYTGGKKRIKKYLEISDDWYFGIDGNVTYEIGLEQVVKEIPKDRLLLETDTPFLTPVPFRGEENQPVYIKYIYEKIGKIWDTGFEETEKVIDENAKRLFQII